MRDTGVYVAAQRWSRPLLEAVGEIATGVILGDLFCQKRMFENEWFDLLDFAQRARSLGLEVVFQSPAYNTTRTVEQTVSLVRKLAGESLLDAALVHDVGVV